MNQQQINFCREWIAALRSGDYKQIKGVHKDEDGGYCVLGLGYALCEGHKFISYGEWNGREVFCARSREIVPSLLIDQSGLSFSELIHISLGMNDVGALFSEIAARIEKLLPEMETA